MATNHQKHRKEYIKSELDFISEDKKGEARNVLNTLSERNKKYGVLFFKDLSEVLSVRAIIDLTDDVTGIAKSIGCSKGIIAKLKRLPMDELISNLHKDKMAELLDNAYNIFEKYDDVVMRGADSGRVHPKHASEISEKYFNRTRLLEEKSTVNVKIDDDYESEQLKDERDRIKREIVEIKGN